MTDRGLPTHRYFGTDSALFLGPLPPAAFHTHHALQGCVALQGRLRVEVARHGATSTVAALIGPDVRHAVSAAGPVAHFYALPETAVGARLVGALAGRPLRELEGPALARVRALLREAPADERRFPTCLDALLRLALRGAPAQPPGDPRVVAALASLRSGSPDVPLADLARRAGLSPDRLRHLIRARTGMPLRRHRRWARLLRALEALREHGSVTAAAHAAGFADAAHLSRVFREAFTFPPSLFARRSHFVQARPGRSA